MDLSSPRTMELVIVPEGPRVGLEAQAPGPSSPAFKSSTSSRCSSCRCCTRSSSSRCCTTGLLPAVPLPTTTVHPRLRIRALHGSPLKVLRGLRPTILRVTLRTCLCEGPSLQTPSLHLRNSRIPPRLTRHLHLQNLPR